MRFAISRSACAFVALTLTVGCNSESPTVPSERAVGSESTELGATSTRVPLTFVVPPDFAGCGNELIVTEGYHHVLEQDGPRRFIIQFNPNRLLGQSVPSGFKYVATGPSRRGEVVAASGVTIHEMLSVIKLQSGKGINLDAFTLFKTVIDANGNVTTEVLVQQASCG